MSRSRDAASERSRPTPARRGEDGGIRLGAAYYPEQWPRERWPVDAELMAEAGLSLVRIGEFAWAQLEPAEGTFDFAWLDDGLEVFAAAGLSVVLGTPTAAPPAWLVERYPEILPRAPDGRVIGFGHRRHYCPNQPAFHDATERIVAALAERYGEDARVIAWQIDNELSGRCFCERCHRAFQDWLESRYSSLDELNERWGTAFWSQTYSSWRQIPLPALGPVPLPHGFLAQSPNPGLALDFRRFSSESMIRYLELQARVLRSRCAPRQRITSNLMGFDFGEIDYHVLAEALDFVSWDNYPVLDREGRWSTAALSADAIRGLRDAPVWVLEQQVGPLGWEMLRTPRRGQLRLHAYQAIAHGAEAVVFFRWRTARFGTEQHWHGILDHDGRPRRRFRDVRCLAGELGRLEGSLAGAPRPADAAILDDYDSRFALQGQPTNPALRYEETIRRHYEGLRRLGLGVDLVSPAADLARYRLVVAAGLYVVGPALAARLASYVEAGGRLVLAPRSGVKDRWNAHPERPLPAWLDELTGLEISDYASLGDEARSAFAWENGGPPAGHFAGWWEELELKGARPIARYLDGEFAGTAAIAEREVGAGRVIYLAGAAEDSTLVELYRRLAAEAGLDVLELPDGVEAVRLGGTSNGLLFLLNHADDERIVELGAGRWRDLVAERDGEGVIELPPFGVALVSEPAPAALAPGRAEESVGADR
jgi:beta-galactosidase